RRYQTSIVRRAGWPAASVPSGEMELVRYGDADLALSEALETDPVVMRELGGPIDRARLPVAHARRVADPWYFTIRPEPAGPPVGTIGIWETEHDSATLHETGWM